VGKDSEAAVMENWKWRIENLAGHPKQW